MKYFAIAVLLSIHIEAFKVPFHRIISKSYQSINVNHVPNNQKRFTSVDSINDECEIYFSDEFLEQLKRKRSYTDILLERFMQTIDDMQVKKRTNKAIALSMQSNKPKEKLMVLGSGWGSYAFLKSVDLSKYDVTVLSPRNYFTFTPMLAASAVGTVEFRSICAPIRNISPLINFVEASALEIDTINKRIDCQSIKCAGTVCEDYPFSVEYDKLLIAVGATVNTFGIKGVKDYCQFLKQVEDAANIRNALAYCFERANVPTLTEEDKATALTFVVVGAGPTGVELIAELKDWIGNEGRRYFPNLIKYVQIVLVEAGSCVLPIFDQQLQQEALESIKSAQAKLVQAGLLEKEMTRVMLSAGVKEVGEKVITLSTGEILPYGFCVWAAGVGPTPLVSLLIQSIPEQKELLSKTRGRVATDGWLRVKGCNDVFCIGDCNFIEDYNLPATAQVASQQGAYLGRLISKSYNLGSYADGPPSKVLEITGNETAVENIPLYPSEKVGFGKLGVPLEVNNVTIAPNGSFKIDYARPFQFLNLGVLAYVGASEALAQVSVDEKNILGSGPLGFLLWRGIYWFKQVSWRNRVLIAFDWMKGRLFGRDIGNVKI